MSPRGQPSRAGGRRPRRRSARGRLLLDPFSGCGRGRGVPKVVVAERLQIVVELVDQRDAGRDVQFDDLGSPRCRRGTSPARAGCCRARRSSTRLPDCDRGAIVSCQYGRNRATVSFSDSVSGRSAGGRVRVARIARRVALVVGVERRRRDVVAAAPDLDLRLAVLGRGFRLVQPLQRAVVPLVQPPVLARPASTADRARRARSSSVRIARFSTDV